MLSFLCALFDVKSLLLLFIVCALTGRLLRALLSLALKRTSCSLGFAPATLGFALHLYPNATACHPCGSFALAASIVGRHDPSVLNLCLPLARPLPSRVPAAVLHESRLSICWWTRAGAKPLDLCCDDWLGRVFPLFRVITQSSGPSSSRTVAVRGSQTQGNRFRADDRRLLATPLNA